MGNLLGRKLEHRMSAEDLAKLAPATRSLSQFTHRLFNALLANPELRQADIFTSGLNVLLAMIMALGGTQPGSACEAELRAALCIGATPEDEVVSTTAALAHALSTADPDSVTISIANSVWSRGILPTFVDKMQRDLHAQAFELGDSEKPINAWCEEHTAGMIKKIIASVSPDTIAILISAIYFKGAWQRVFDRENTTMMSFTTLSGETVPCNMMRMSIPNDAPYCRYGVIGGLARALELSYGTGAIRTLLVLPNDPGEAALDATWAAMSATGELDYNTLTSNMRKSLVDLCLPRFSSEFGTDLVTTFKGLGVVGVFEANGMSQISPDARISHIIHKAVLRVNEEGAEAAAVTAVEVTNECMQIEIPFYVDRPFYYIIGDTETGAVLFLGRIVQPSFSKESASA